MTTIETYINQNDFKKKPGALEHVYLRCTSLLKLISFQMMRSADTEAIGKRYAEGADQYSDLLLQNPDFNLKFAADQIARMTAAYVERYKASQARTGNATDDPILRSDIATCTAPFRNR